MDSDFDMDDAVFQQIGSQVDKELEAVKPSAAYVDCLQTNFGHGAFRPMQWDIIRSIIEDKRDNCVVMPTGYGKSLCFQFPAVFTKGITLVVSPLISLMQDQVSALSVANIPACFLGSAQTDQTIRSQATAGQFRMVYASPEYVNGSSGQDLLRKLEPKLTLIAIDESHCISAYGHAFRPDYRKLGSIRKEVPSVPILAVTATATEHVRDDICSSLRLRNPLLTSMGFDRPNIHFSFKAKTKNIWDDLKAYVTGVRGSVIIYVLKKSISEDIARALREKHIHCDIYHAGLSQSKRRTVLDDFIKDRLRIIVATIAFGMGIDKPDVRRVVHYGASKNIESYYQEVGRAGRDGLPSRAITLFDKGDFGLHEWFLNENHERQSETVLQHLREIGHKMRDFCHTSQCRRKYILDYFGSDVSPIKPRTNCCDNCDSGQSRITLSDTYEGIDCNGNYDFTANAYVLLKAMDITSKVSVAISVLRGSSEKKALEFKHEQEIYGTGKIWPKEYWTVLVEQLKAEGYITLKKLPLPYKPIQIISPKGAAWLRNSTREKLIFKAKPEMFAYFKKKPAKKVTMDNSLQVKAAPVIENEKILEDEYDQDVLLEMESNNQHLEEILLGVRGHLAKTNDCMPYSIASNTAIQQMVQMKPVNLKSFKTLVIDGFSLAKIEKFAPYFVNAIVKFMDDEFYLSKLLRTIPLTTQPTKLSEQNTRQLKDLINENQSVASIATRMAFSSSEIVDEIVILIRSGFPITKTHLLHLLGVTDEMLIYINETVTSDDFATLSDISLIKGKFSNNPAISEQVLALVMNYLKVRQFFTSIGQPFFDIDKNQLVNGDALVRTMPVLDPNAGSSKPTIVQPPKPVQPTTVRHKTVEHKPAQNKPSSSKQSADLAMLLDEDENLFDNIDFGSEAILPNKVCNDKAKVPTKAVSQAKKPKRQAIEYLSDSDSEEPETKVKCKSTLWITAKKPTTNQQTIRKNPLF